MTWLLSNGEYGEMSLESADVYFEYGNALLQKEEENPSDGLLGNVDPDPVVEDVGRCECWRRAGTCSGGRWR